MKILKTVSGLAMVCLPLDVAAQEWGGAYAGGAISLGMAEMESFDSDEYTSYGYARVDGFASVLSGKLGYNFQTGGLVYGPELSVGVASFDEALEYDFCSPTTVSAEVSGVSSLKGRIGFAVENVLVYGSAGVAYLEGKSTLQCDTDFTDEVEGATAFAASIGAEYLVSDDLSLSFEYTAIRGDDETTFADDDDEDLIGFSTDLDLFAVGVNYRFN